MDNPEAEINENSWRLIKDLLVDMTSSRIGDSELADEANDLIDDVLGIRES